MTGVVAPLLLEPPSLLLMELAELPSLSLTDLGGDEAADETEALVMTDVVLL